MPKSMKKLLFLLVDKFIQIYGIILPLDYLSQKEKLIGVRLDGRLPKTIFARGGHCCRIISDKEFPDGENGLDFV
jgi:hypothetical protein